MSQGEMVIVAHEKNGTFLYASALDLLRERVAAGYWYENWDDGNPRHEWATRAQAITSETAAWSFLLARSDHEYEAVEKQWVN